MRRLLWAGGVAGLMALAADAGPVKAQIGGTPAAPVGVAPAGPAPGAAATIASATPAKLGFFQRACVVLDECKRKLCLTPAGALLNNATRPASMMTGGVIPQFCPLMPSDKDLAKPGVAGAAAMAQKEALEAKQRREAVRFLGTLDCRYFPDAAVALAAALRTDSSECVRWEAALVLGRGCCCTELTIKALEASVSGMEIDGNPAERSVRVRMAAAAALERCLSCYVPPAEPPATPPVETDVEPKLPKTPDNPGDPLAPPARLPPVSETKAKADKPVLAAGSRTPSKATVERARKTLAAFQEQVALAGPMLAPPAGGMPVAGRQSLYQLINDTADRTDAGPVVGGPRDVIVGHPVSTSVPMVPPAPAAPAVKPPVPPAIPMPMPPAETKAPPLAPAPKSVPVSKPAAPATPAAANPAPPPVVKPDPRPTAATPPADLPPVLLVAKPIPVPAEVPPAPVAPAVKPAPIPVAATVPPAAPVSVPVPPVVKPALAPVAATPRPVAPPLPTVTAAPAVKPAANIPAIVSAIPARPSTPTPPPAALPASVAVQKAAPPAMPAAPAVQPASRTETATVTTAAGWAEKVRTAQTPADRQAAVRQLSAFDAKTNPVVVDTLVAGARFDTDRGVRVECLHRLAAYPAALPQVWGLTADADPVVRKEATEVMSKIRTGP